MLQDLLRQRGISARLEGAGLQSGVGELPAIGLVRLIVEEDDFDAARAVIDEWEKTAIPDPISLPPKQPVGAFVGALIGLALGIGAALMYFHSPANVDGIDYDDDGVLDERWKSSPAGTPIETEIDRNFDGDVDFVQRFDRYGQVDSGESDDDFNGTFESQFRYRDGQVYFAQADTDGDGIPDLKSRLKFGVLLSEEHRAASSHLPIRIETCRLGRLVRADVDTDRDGMLDRLYTYDALGEVASVWEIGSSNDTK